MLRNMTAIALVTMTAGAGCATSETESVQEADEQALMLDSQFLRGFIADGTGCATIGDPIVSGNSVTFILTDYVAEVAGRGLDRATCDFAVEIALPPGLTISLDEVIYRGFADGSDARSTFYREYFFAGEFIGDRRFTVQQYDSTGNVTTVQDDSDQYIRNFGEFTALDDVLSAGRSVCGETIVWRANTALSVRNYRTSSFSLASLDTVDVQNQFFVTFDFTPRFCP
jgi:hypothetical protein